VQHLVIWARSRHSLRDDPRSALQDLADIDCLSASHLGRPTLALHPIVTYRSSRVNLGFQDARCLQTQLREAQRAGRDLSDPVILAAYESQRRPANRRMMMAMDLFYHLFSNRMPPLHLLRNLGLGAAKAMPFARNQVARYAMGIDDELPPLARQIAQRLPGLKY